MNALDPKQLAEAHRRSRRLYRSVGFRNTYVRGAVAALSGRSIDSCPYPPGGQTWRSAYRIAWSAGHRSVAPDEE